MKTKIISAVLALCLLLSSCGLNNETNTDNEEYNTGVKEEIRAVWIKYDELNEIINSSENVSQLEENINSIVLNCKSLGLNRIILHIRAFSDAYYCSKLFDYAECLSQKIKSNKEFDPLMLFCKLAHENGLKLDAWFNPYRISYSNDLVSIEKKTIIKEMISSDINNRDIVVIEKGIFFNPASKKVQKLILDGVREILEGYEVDGIHIDDYFYPITDPEFDSSSYNEYINNSGCLELSEWRTENINSLLSQIYSVIKAYDDKITFSVSPCGNIKTNTDEYFADVKLWCSQTGYADYIIPQIYFGFENEKMPFENVLSEWIDLTDKSKVKLCFGLACYKCGNVDEYAGSGKNEWLESFDIISRQICLIREKNNCYGFCLYSYSSLFSKKNDENSNLQLQNIKNVLSY